MRFAQLTKKLCIFTTHTVSLVLCVSFACVTFFTFIFEIHTLLTATRLSLAFSSDDASKPCIIVEGSSHDKSASATSDSPDGIGGHHRGGSTEGPMHPLHSGSGSPMSPGGGSSSSSSRSESLSSCHALNLPRNPVAFPELRPIGDYVPVSASLEAYASWSGSLIQSSGGFLRFHFVGLPPWARLAFLAAKNEAPTLTQHELLELINPNKHTTSGSGSPGAAMPSTLGGGGRLFRKRDSDRQTTSQSGVSVELLDYFEPGTWFITIINDGADTVPLVLNISSAAEIPSHCLNNCNGHGKCHLGKCQCFPGFIGHDCADSKHTQLLFTDSYCFLCVFVRMSRRTHILRVLQFYLLLLFLITSNFLQVFDILLSYLP